MEKKKKGGGNEWKESKVNYVFDNEMSGTHLIKKLNWIGRMNNLMGNFFTTTTQNGNDDDDDNDNDDNDGRSGSDGNEDQYVSPSLLTTKKRRTRSSGGLLLGKGVKRKRRRGEEEITMMDERELRREFLEMSNTLSNLTLHWQNLGSMLPNYCSQCKNMKKNQRHELAHFFNMTSNILNIIGSMTENTILRSVEFNKKGGELKGAGGGVFGNENKGLNNKPPPALFPNAENLSRYTAIFLGIHLTMGMC